MTRRFALYIARLVLAALVTSLAAEPANSDPSVLVQLIPLKKGTLPQVVIAYGSVQASSSARQTVMAPLSAVVENVYVRQGAEVAKDTPLIRLVPTPKAVASYAQAKSALGVATQLVERTRTMVRQHLATEQQLANARKSESDARAALAALQAQGAGGPKVLRAPFRAIVTGLSTSPGAIVAEGAALLDLAQPEGLVLRVGVIPARAATIAPGAKVSITPIGEKKTFSGKVLLRGSIVEPGNGLVPVEIALPPQRFVPGQMAEAAITTGEVYGYVIPHEAILIDRRGVPYVVQAVNMIARKVSVQILGANGGKDVVDGQLDATAPLVLAGNHQLENGMRVRVADPGGKAAQ